MKTAEKRAAQLEVEIKRKTEELDGVYSQIDSMNECFSKLDQDHDSQKANFQKQGAQLDELTRAKMESDLKLQKVTREKSDLERVVAEKISEISKLNEIQSQLNIRCETNVQIVANLNAQVEDLNNQITENRVSSEQLRAASELFNARLEVSMQAYGQMQVALAESKTECEDLKQKQLKLKELKKQVPKSQTPSDLSEYVLLKYDDWKKKMLCMTCR